MAKTRAKAVENVAKRVKKFANSQEDPEVIELLKKHPPYHCLATIGVGGEFDRNRAPFLKIIKQ